MELIRAESRAAVDPEPKHFTGQAWIQRPRSIAGDLKEAVVYFAPRSRTDWHAHPGGQLLYVLSGRGRAGSRQGEFYELLPGDVLVTPPRAEHWHGAAPDSFMCHLAVMIERKAGKPTKWGVPVDEEAYDPAPGRLRRRGSG